MANNTYGISYEEYTENMLSLPTEAFRGEGKYYHYTSLESCIKMLEHENGIFEMWASHLSYLNDKEEHINGLKMIERKVEDLLLSKGDDLSDWIEEYREGRNHQITLANEIFVICFCSKRSLLSQWKYYGKNSGIAIQYNLEKCVYSGYIEGIENIKIEEQKYIRNPVCKVIYDNMEKQTIIDDFIKDNIYNVFNGNEDKIGKKRKIYRYMDELYALAPLFKHDSFMEENESRLLFRPIYMESAESASNLIHYRVNDGKIIPYMKIKIKSNDEGNVRIPVIKSLTIGPGQNQDLIFEALRHFVWNKFPKEENQFEILQRRDYSYIKINGIEIRKASMPFRD